MYCKKCGIQIDNDSEFCRKCGTKTTPISPDIKKPNTQTTTTNIASKNSSSTFNVLFKFFIFVVIAFFIFAGVMKCVKEFDDKGNSINSTSTSSNKNPIQQLITRDANNNDIEFETETNYKKLGVDVKIHPNCDIEDLVIKIEILDGNEKVIERIRKNIGNVKEGVELTRTVSITDISFFDTLKSRYFRVIVVGGTVSYFD